MKRIAREDKNTIGASVANQGGQKFFQNPS